MYRFKRSVRVPYNRQACIYHFARMYRELPPEQQTQIKALCDKHGGEYRDALFAFVTTDDSAIKICQQHYIGKDTLYRVVRKFYEAFPALMIAPNEKNETEKNENERV